MNPIVLGLMLVLSESFHPNQDKYSEQILFPLLRCECHQRVSAKPATRHRRRSGPGVDQV